MEIHNIKIKYAEEDEMALEEVLVEEIPNEEIERDLTLLDRAKGFTVDAVTNISFWQPVLVAYESLVLGFEPHEVRNARLGHLGFQIILGGFFGKALDAGRYMFNRPYYDQEVNGIQRKENIFTKTRDFAVDTGTATAYWGTCMVPILRYANDFEWEKVGACILAYTIPTLLGSYPFGKLLNWSRRTFNKKEYGGDVNERTEID